jgi:hypothetical protein
VGLIKGAIWKQIAWSTEKAIELGCESFALPSRELVKLGLFDGVISAIMSVFRKSKKDIQLLLYGLSYPLRGSMFVYSGLSWFIGAKKGYYYKGKHSFFPTDTYMRFEECSCIACNGRMPTQLKDDLRSFALHNLLQTVERFR